MNRIPNDKDSGPILIAGEEDDDELLFAADAEGGLVVESDEFDEQVQLAQEQLLHLRHQQQLIEKQKAEIEDLKIRRREFLDGRSQLVDRLSRAVVSLERETFETQKKVEQFLQTKDSFERHLEAIEQFNPDEWSRAEMRAELSRALGVIDDARTEYQKGMARMHTLMKEDEDITSPPPAAPRNPIASSTLEGKPNATAPLPECRDFGYWFRAGLAFTLPLIAFGLFALILHLLIG